MFIGIVSCRHSALIPLSASLNFPLIFRLASESGGVLDGGDQMKGFPVGPAEAAAAAAMPPPLSRAAPRERGRPQHSQQLFLVSSTTSGRQYQGRRHIPAS